VEAKNQNKSKIFVTGRRKKYAENQPLFRTERKGADKSRDQGQQGKSKAVHLPK